MKHQNLFRIKQIKKTLKFLSGGSDDILCSAKLNHTARTECNNIIKNNIKNIQCNNNNKCFINDAELITEKIGSGANGEIFAISINISNESYTFVLKKGKINTDILIQGLLDNNNVFANSPHFLYYYQNNNNLLILEKANGSLTTLFKDTNLNDPDIMNIFCQIFIAIYTYHKYIGYYHDDTKLDNILYIKNDTTNTIIYKFNEYIYILPKTNYIVVLADFGNSSEMNYLISKDFYFTAVINDYIYAINSFIDNFFHKINKNISKFLIDLYNICLDTDDEIKVYYNQHKTISIQILSYYEKEFIKNIFDLFIKNEIIINNNTDQYTNYNAYNLIFDNPNNSINVKNTKEIIMLKTLFQNNEYKNLEKDRTGFREIERIKNYQKNKKYIKI